MSTQHSDITDPNIHEPKGASTASVGTVYVSDGAGSGTWGKLDEDNLDTVSLYADIETSLGDGTISVTSKYYIHIVIPDVSTAQSVIVPVIEDSTVVQARCVLGGPITVADAAVSFKNSAAASMGTDVTVAYDGSAKGDAYTFTASGNNVLSGPTWIEIATDGGSTDAQALYITIELTAVLNG
jgi:hypothetical protein